MGATDLVQKLTLGMKLELESIDYLLAQLRVELGIRPEDWGTGSAFEKPGHAVSDIKGLFGTLDAMTKKYD
jgi:hypothetical protein